jgi:hypothetical protein
MHRNGVNYVGSLLQLRLFKSNHDWFAGHGAGPMEQALWENKLRNLLWLLRSAAASYPLGSGLDKAFARATATEQSTAENAENDVSPLWETIDFGASAAPETDAETHRPGRRKSRP